MYTGVHPRPHSVSFPSERLDPLLSPGQTDKGTKEICAYPLPQMIEHVILKLKFVKPEILPLLYVRLNTSNTQASHTSVERLSSECSRLAPSVPAES